jgi:hypothetical protein
VERITFCAACGEPSSARTTRCESCDAPLRKLKFARLRMPRVSPLSILIAIAVIAVAVAIATHVIVGS